jgi:hypothetical protein
MRVAALSIDLDEIRCYAEIHGLDGGAVRGAHAVYRCAVPRFETWLDALGMRATFFVIGSDLGDAEAAATVLRLHRAGHEIANHTFSHRYDFSRGTRESIRDEIARGNDAIARVTGEAPVGFRAPGYNVVDAVFDALAELGFAYDSSVFPCPAYYGARAAALGWIRARGRRSHSIAGDPGVLLADADPYRVGRPYWRHGDGILELPIGVTGAMSGRLPFIGTALALAGPSRAAWLARRIAGRPLVNLELHGIDLADAERDGLDWLVPHQPDLRRPAGAKEAALTAAVEVLREAGYAFVPLREAARRCGEDARAAA